MTMLDKMKAVEESNEAARKVDNAKGDVEGGKKDKKEDVEASSSESQLLNTVESQFKDMMEEFRANAGFSVDTGEQPVDTMIELLSGKEVAVSVALLLSYIRYCVNHGLKKDITLKIGYNKPPVIPMNFAINEELLGEIYPGDVVEIN